MSELVTLKFRRGTTSEWASTTSILAAGEPGVDLTTGNLKIGNGFSKWADLPAFKSGSSDVLQIGGYPSNALLTHNGSGGIAGSSQLTFDGSKLKLSSSGTDVNAVNIVKNSVGSESDTKTGKSALKFSLERKNAGVSTVEVDGALKLTGPNGYGILKLDTFGNLLFTSIVGNGLERTVDEALNSNLNRRISVDLSQFEKISGGSSAPNYSLNLSVFFQKSILIGGAKSINNPYSYLVIKFTDSKSSNRFYKFTYQPSLNTKLYTFKGSEPNDTAVTWCLDDASGVADQSRRPGNLEQTNNASKVSFAGLVLAGSGRLNVEVTEFEKTTITEKNFTNNLYTTRVAFTDFSRYERQSGEGITESGLGHYVLFSLETGYDYTINGEFLYLYEITDIENSTFPLNKLLSSGSTIAYSGDLSKCCLLVAGTAIGSRNLTFQRKVTEDIFTYSNSSKTVVTGLRNPAYAGAIVIPPTVVSISVGAFSAYAGLTSVTIPPSVLTIGEGAFRACTGLTTLVLNTGLETIGKYAFSDCTGLTGVTIPSSVLSIGESAFQGCRGLTSLNLSAATSLKTIGESAFDGCKKLTGVTIPPSVLTIGEAAFFGCTGLTTLDLSGATNLETFGLGAFRQCTGLTSVTLPPSVLSVGEYAFQECTGLTTLVLNTGLKDIGTAAFYGCTGLTELTIPPSVLTIGESAFAGCTLDLIVSEDLYDVAETWNQSFMGTITYASIFRYSDDSRTEITGLKDANYAGAVVIPSRVVRINGSAFSETKITSLDLSEATSLQTIGESVFYDCTGLTTLDLSAATSLETIGGNAFNTCNGLSGTLTIPSSVLTIGDGAFRACTGLTTLVLNTGLETIGFGAFFSCTGLTGVTIPSSVLTIGERAFNECTGLTTLVLNTGLKTIGTGAFSECNALTGTLTIPYTVETVSENAFQGCGLNKIIVFQNLFDTKDEWAQGFEGEIELADIFTYSDKTKTVITGLIIPNYTGAIIIPDGVEVIASDAFANSKITSLDLSEATGLTGIGEGAFANCKITSLDLSGATSLTTIGNGAFINSKITTLDLSGATGLTNIGDYAFYDCTELTGVSIPSSVLTIGDEAFAGCLGLTTLDLSGATSLETIGESAFFSCTGLTGVTIPSSVLTIGRYAFHECTGLITLDLSGATSLETIGEAAFRESTGLTGTLTIPSNILTIGNSAFTGCSGLTTLDLSGATSLQTIGESAFTGCSGLTTLDLSGATGLTSIGGNAFNNCNGLSGTLTIPSSVLTIGEGAFRYCTLDKIIVPYNLFSTKDEWATDFDGEIELEDIFTYDGMSDGKVITGLKDANYPGPVIIPSTVEVIASDAFSETKITSLNLSGATSLTGIGEGAFYDCNGLTGVTIPSSVLTIYNYAFSECSGLTTLDLSGATKLKTIGISAFDGCTELTGVTIPANIETIGNSAFSFCDKLTTLDLSVATNLTTIDNSAFAECGLTSLDLSGATSLATVENFAFRQCIGLAGKTVNIRSSTLLSSYAFYEINPSVIINRM